MLWVRHLIFAPILYIASSYTDKSLIPTAAILTLMMFVGITTVAFTSGKDFSFLGGFLRIGGFIALGLIICSALFGFGLGLIFSALMIVFASVAILYTTSNTSLRRYATHQYVAASLELFASVALLFYYILMTLMRLAQIDIVNSDRLLIFKFNRDGKSTPSFFIA